MSAMLSRNGLKIRGSVKRSVGENLCSASNCCIAVTASSISVNSASMLRFPRSQVSEDKAAYNSDSDPPLLLR